ncbi:MAG: transketolase family protein, partial [Acidimicrobiia bacterium]
GRPVPSSSPSSTITNESMRDRFTHVVGDLLDTDERAVVVLAVISHGLFASGGVEARHPDRIIDVGIREQAQLGVAGGLALEGFTPIVTGYAPFLIERAFEQVKLDFSHQGTSAILASVGGSWDSAGSGRTHQAPEDVAIMTALRDWTVHVPGHADEMEMALRESFATGTRAYIRMTNDANAAAYSQRPGDVVELRRGSEHAPTVLSIGPTADDVIAASESRDMTVLYTASPFPIDAGAIRSLVRGQDLLVVEPYLVGTSVAPIVEALDGRLLRVRSHGVRDVDLHSYGTPGDHKRAHGLDAEGIRKWFDLSHGVHFSR